MPMSELQKETLLNNTFDLTALEEVLNEVKINSFNQLYSTQLDLTSITRFNLKMNDLVLMNVLKQQNIYSKKYVKSIEFDFIGHEKRRVYKNSNFYNKEIGIFDISNNPDIFTHSFLVFIGNKFFDSISLLIQDSNVYIVFNIYYDNSELMNQNYFDSLVNDNLDITVFFIPNNNFNIYSTDINILNEYKNSLSLQEMGLENNLDNDSSYVSFINLNNLLFCSIIANSTDAQDLLRFFDNSINPFNNKFIHLNIFGLTHLSKKIDLVGNEKYFEIPIKAMPIPIENIIVFRNIDGVKYFAHDISLKLYYPNIYEIIGNDNLDDLTLLIFYSEDSLDNIILQYKNELELYYKFTSNVIDKYKDTSIPDIIKNYQPFNFVYGLNDFKQDTSYPDHLQYKIDKLRFWILQNTNILRSYLYKQMDYSSGYYIDISKIDLLSKYRENNHLEILDVALQEIFLEPRYIFILKNEYSDDYYNLRFFIDGSLYIPDKIFKDTKYEYYYIPTTLINEDSIIEIEKFEEFSYETGLTFFDVNDVKSISLPIAVRANDIFFVLESNNMYVNKENFIISIEQNGETVDLVSNSSMLIKDFNIKVISDTLTQILINMHIKKVSFFKYFTIETISDILSVTKFTDTVNNDGRNFRIFRNGSLLPSQAYTIKFRDELDEEHRIIMDMVCKIGDNYIVDYVPYKFKQVYYQQNISENGFVDLTGSIDKPFDLKWFDVYLNGCRLNRNNIDIISPTKIFIKNVNTIKNLSIFEKDRDDEYFKLNGSSPNDYLWDNIGSISTEENIQHPIINDIIDDLITQIISVVGPQLYDFYEVIMNYNMFINPDVTNVFGLEDIEIYSEIFVPDTVLLLNPDDGFNGDIYMEINPQV